MDFSASTHHWSLVGALVMTELVFVSSDSQLRESVLAALPSSVSVVTMDGDLESIVSALRRGPLDIVWDLAAEWLSPQVLLGLLQETHIERSRWFWLRRERTRWEDVPQFGESLLLPMSPELIVATVYPRRESSQPEIRGAFEALSLPDLLQTLGMNNRDVRVTLDFSGETGVIELRSGCLAQVEFRGHRGIKAMCRLLEEEGGTFSMTDRSASDDLSLISSIGEALMMAVQFKDEKANLLAEVFPDLRVVLGRTENMSCPVGEKTREFELWSLLASQKTLRSLIETSELPDAMVLKVLRDWVEVGAIKLAASQHDGVVFLSSALERRLKAEFKDKSVRDFVSVCSNASEVEQVLDSWRQVDGFVEHLQWSREDAIVEIGTLLHYDVERRYPVVCWVSDLGDLSPWAQWRASNSVFLIHHGSEQSALGESILRHPAFLATRDVGFSGLDVLRGLERTIARLS